MSCEKLGDGNSGSVSSCHAEKMRVPSATMKKWPTHRRAVRLLVPYMWMQIFTNVVSWKEVQFLYICWVYGRAAGFFDALGAISLGGPIGHTRLGIVSQAVRAALRSQPQHCSSGWVGRLAADQWQFRCCSIWEQFDVVF